MAKIINFPNSKNDFDCILNEKISKVEEELNLQEEPLTVLTDDSCTSLINDLIDAKESIEEALGILGFKESETLPWGEE